MAVGVGRGLRVGVVLVLGSGLDVAVGGVVQGVGVFVVVGRVVVVGFWAAVEGGFVALVVVV